MGFNSVYRCLQEIFPQVDARLLRAVAIEHPKDADLAAGIVLTEVIPLMSKSLPPATPPQDKAPGAPINVEVETEEEGNTLKHCQLDEVLDVDVGSSSAPHFISVEMTKTAPQDKAPGAPINVEVESEEEGSRFKHCRLVEVVDVGSSSAPHFIPVEMTKTADCSSGPDLNVALDESALSNASNSNDGTDKFLGMNETEEVNIFWNAEDNFTGDISNKIAQETSSGFRQEASENFDQGRVHVDAVGENLISSGMCQEMEPDQNYLGKEASSANNNGNRIVNHLNEEWVDFVGPSADDYDATVCDKNHLLEKCETALIEVESSGAPAGQGHASNARDSLQSEIDSHTSIAIGESPENGYSFFKQDFCISEASDIEDETGENNAVSQSSQVCRIDLLEEIIDESKTNKKTLFSSMESVINLMREVELQEKAAEQANMEAARGGSHILVRVEEYKTMLAHAKEANDMHAGEVYGEKAILATELRELQSRLVGLSDERDKSLVILDEMHQILEARLAVAEELRKAAEHEKLEKEESAQNALAEQEAMMEKVVQESVRLQQEAEENSKLREFLMDRGRVVDTLQGEISVICQDIRLLKEKFDANLPLSKSLTWNQTSCILASSGSSHKTVASDAGSVHSDSSEIPKTSPAASVASLCSKSGHEEERSKIDHKALLDDGWDIFEKDAELNS